MNEETEPVQKRFGIDERWRGLSVMEAVKRAFPEVMPRDVFKQARTGELVVNGIRCVPLDKLRVGDEVTLTVHELKRFELIEPDRTDAQVETTAGPFFIVWEDPHLLVVSKASGCASHPALRRAGDTLMDRVRAYLCVMPGQEFQPALANRLDIGTSGLVLIGKNPVARKRLGRMLQKGAVEKFYLTLVGGHVGGRGVINDPLMRKPNSRELAKFKGSDRKLLPKLQESLTRYRTLRKVDHPFLASLIEAELVTGRMHQIRRHFSGRGFPLALDERYGDPEFNREFARITGLMRMFLHAHRVKLKHPVTGQPLDLTGPLEEDLRQTLNELGIRGDIFKDG